MGLGRAALAVVVQVWQIAAVLPFLGIPCGLLPFVGLVSVTLPTINQASARVLACNVRAQKNRQYRMRFFRLTLGVLTLHLLRGVASAQEARQKTKISMPKVKDEYIENF